MTKRPALIAKKTKQKPRFSRNESYIVNLKYLGPEPEFDGPLTSSDMNKAFNWYNYMCDHGDAREYIKEFLDNNNRKDELKKLSQIADVWVPTTVGWICCLINRGFEVPDTSKKFLETSLAKALSHAVKEPKLEKNNVISVQQRMRERQHDIIGDIEEMIDKGEAFSLYDWLKSNQIPATYCQAIVSYYAPWVDELIQAYEEPDPQLKEAYRHLTKKKLKERIIFMHSLISDAKKYGNVVKTTKAPRKAKPVSADKLLKHLKYQKEDGTYKIASVNPQKVIGAQELWTFNTKYKILTVFRAKDKDGLSVKGTSIIGYDENTSCSRKAGRKPEQHIQTIQTGGKVTLRKLMDEIDAKAVLAHRINENTVLLKVTS
jgi:hypothetical protein